MIEFFEARLDELRVAWSLGQGVRRQPSWYSPFVELKLVIRCVRLRFDVFAELKLAIRFIRLWFEKSSPTWRIVEVKIKNRVFLNSTGVSSEKGWACDSPKLEIEDWSFWKLHEAFESKLKLLKIWDRPTFGATLSTVAAIWAIRAYLTWILILIQIEF